MYEQTEYGMAYLLVAAFLVLGLLLVCVPRPRKSDFPDPVRDAQEKKLKAKRKLAAKTKKAAGKAKKALAKKTQESECEKVGAAYTGVADSKEMRRGTKTTTLRRRLYL